MSDFSIKAVLGMDSTGFKNELRSIGSSITGFVDKAATALAAATGAAAFIGLSKGALDLAANIKDMALNMGIGAQAYQALQFAAEEAGVSQDQFDQGLKHVKESVIEAAEGNSKLADAFTDLGLNANYLLTLPLDQQYAAIATAVADASDQASAYNDVVEIFGSRVGPAMMDSLRSLAQEGLPEVIDQATKAGQVMSNETIAGLNEASKAIQKFKRDAQVAVGNILVSFETDKGLEVLYDRFREFVSWLGGKIGDAINYAASMGAAVFSGAFDAVCIKLQNGLINAFIAAIDVFNKTMPKTWEISVKYLKSRIDANSGIMDHINEKVAQVPDSNVGGPDVKKWDDDANKASDQAKQELDTNLKDDINKLSNAGKPVQVAMTDGAKAVSESAEDAAKEQKLAAEFSAAQMQAGGVYIADAVYNATGNLIGGAVKAAGILNGVRGGSEFNSASDSALKEIIQRNTEQIETLDNHSVTTGGWVGGGGRNIGDDSEIARLKLENQNAQQELDSRNKIIQGFSQGGIEGAYGSAPNIDPIMIDKIVQQLNLANNPDSKQTVSVLMQIQQGLAKAGLGG